MGHFSEASGEMNIVGIVERCRTQPKCKYSSAPSGIESEQFLENQSPEREETMQPKAGAGRSQLMKSHSMAGSCKRED
jgi:hypothetical protein